MITLAELFTLSLPSPDGDVTQLLTQLKFFSDVSSYKVHIKLTDSLLTESHDRITTFS